jgi:autotransporter passenger strand-loop-strand repeat protein
MTSHSALSAIIKSPSPRPRRSIAGFQCVRGEQCAGCELARRTFEQLTVENGYVELDAANTIGSSLLSGGTLATGNTRYLQSLVSLTSGDGANHRLSTTISAGGYQYVSARDTALDTLISSGGAR